MDRQDHSSVIRVSLSDWLVDESMDDEPRYAISVVIARAGVRRSALLRYEEWGLLEPTRAGNQRLYSEADIDRIRRIRRLMDDLGVNLAGAAAVLHLRQQLVALQGELQALKDQHGY